MTPQELIAKVRELAHETEEEYNKEHDNRFTEGWWMDAVSCLEDLADAMQGDLESAQRYLAQDQDAQPND
jgi:hypothetical protein